MLSTSNKTKFSYQYLLIAVLLFAMVLVIALYQSGVMPTISVDQSATQNLTTLSAAEVSAYRWDAMARFYAGQASSAANLSWPSRPDFSHLNQQVIIPVTSVDGLAVYHSSEWGASVAVQNSLAQYYHSERGTFTGIQKGMSIYHQSERNSVQGMSFHYTSPGR